jgi:hypothetical protein
MQFSSDSCYLTPLWYKYLLSQILKNKLTCVGLDILTALIMTSGVVWDVTPCIQVEVHESSGGKLPPSSGSNCCFLPEFVLFPS